MPYEQYDDSLPYDQGYAGGKKPRQVAPRVFTPERQAAQDEYIDELIRRGGTRDQIAEQRKLLDSLSEGEFSQAIPTYKPQTQAQTGYVAPKPRKLTAPLPRVSPERY